MARGGRAGVVAAMVVSVALLAGGCGGGGGGDGEVASRAEFDERHGEALAAFGRDLDATSNTLNQGDRTAILPSCNQLGESARELREDVLPVADAEVQRTLTAAFDAAAQAAATCRTGAQTGEARTVEQAMAEMGEAREALDRAEAALAAWS
jgi:hypothetical protein